MSENKETKNYFITVDGVDVPVTEEQYQAFKRPAWAERKRRQVRAERERSLEAFMDEGFDIADTRPLVEAIVEDRLMLEMLFAALEELTDDERGLIDGVYFNERSLREYARQIGSNHTKVVRLHNRILDKLRNILKKYL